MRRSLVKAALAVAAVAALVAALPLAQAGTPNRNHPVNITVRTAAVNNVGNTTIDAAQVTGGLGEGAALIRSKSAGGNQVAVTFKLWYTAGLQRGAGTLTATPTPTGADLVGNLRYTGGTGTFKGITGRLQLDGALDGTTGIITAKVTGNARY
jgi:hypothetical protein